MRERLCLMMVCLVCFPAIVRATEVTFRLENQANELITESYFDVVTAGKNSIPQNGTVTLAPGVHKIIIRPGINKSFFGTLQREESVTISGVSQPLTFKWKTAPLTVIVNDQSSKPIGGSLFRVGTYRPGFIRDYATVAGKSIQLPVTEDTDFAPISGISASGYELKLLPGINGHQGFLERLEPSVELTIDGLTRTFTWKTAPVIVDLRDQSGAPIPGSRLRIGVRTGFFRDFATVDAGQPINLPVTEDPSTTPITGAASGGYEVQLWPAINGQASYLERLEPAEELTSTGTSRMFAWKTAPVKVDLWDQNSASIPGSRIRIGIRTGFFREFARVDAGQPINLPVTEDPSTTPITGAASGGYEVQLWPGINGQASYLERLEPAEELTSTGTSRMFEWKMAPVKVDLRDQNSAPIPGSRIRIGIRTGFFREFARVDASQPINLPVTEDPSTTPITGAASGGYEVQLWPGINGQASYLERLEPAEELTSTGTSRMFEWKTAPIIASLLDQIGAPIPGSLIRIGITTGFFRDFATVDAGKRIDLPVTEDPNSTPITGVAAGGYEFKLLPGINGHQNLLERLEPALELSASGVDRSFIWQVANGTLHIVNGAESEVAGASFLLTPPFPESKSGTLVTLPVNDKSLYPTIAGRFGAGYPFSLRFTGGSVQSPSQFVLRFGETFNPLFASIANGQHGLRFDLQKTDADGDGFANCVDCNDFDPKIHPRAVELPGDTIDENCDGERWCSPSVTYRNHDAFIACVSATADALFKGGRITEAEKGALIERAK